MSILNEIIRNIVVIVLLATFLDMLLPNSDLRRFIKVIMGLFIMVTILNPIISIFTSDSNLSNWSFTLPVDKDMESILVGGESITVVQKSQAIKEYKSRIEKQIESLIHLIPEVAKVNCTAEFKPTDDVKNLGIIDKVFLKIFLATNEQNQLVEPVKIELGDPKQEDASVINDPNLESKVINLVSNYYSIPEESIYLDLIYEEEERE